MQNTNSPNRFFFTFPHDDSWDFNKIFHVIKMLTFTLLCKYMILLFFGWPQLAFFSSKLYDNFFVKSEQIYNNNNDHDNNQCEEVSWKDILVRF